MIEIVMTRGLITVIDDCDADLANKKWTPTGQSDRLYATRSWRDPAFKLINRDKRIRECLHRVIMERIVGHPIPKEIRVDHIDGNQLNNQRGNLRLASPAQNVQNSKKYSTNKSGYKGVCYRKKYNKWEASIKSYGKWKYLGHYNTPEEAHEAYCKAAKELHGEFARFD